METMAADKLVVFTNKKCLICCEGEDDYNLGILHDLQVFSVHYLCLLTGINSYPSTNNEGLLGFLIGDIYSVYRKYLNILCEYCKKCGASLECNSCMKKYHLPCGVRNGIRMQMLGSFPSYCKDCAYEIFPKSDDYRKFTCAICFCPSEGDDILYWPKCCKPDRMIHFDCLKLYALSAGYLMKCPLCMNKYKFRSTSRQFGVYIPNTDADWLIENPDKYILYPLHCCAKICIMDPYEEMSTILTPCLICELKVAHMECTFSNIFLCVDCTTMLWPGINQMNLNSGVANLSETFTWLFPLLATVKYRKDLETIPNEICESIGEKIGNDETVDWSNVLSGNSSNLIATKIIEHYDDYVAKKFTGELISKKEKR